MASNVTNWKSVTKCLLNSITFLHVQCSPVCRCMLLVRICTLSLLCVWAAHKSRKHSQCCVFGLHTSQEGTLTAVCLGCTQVKKALSVLCVWAAHKSRRHSQCCVFGLHTSQEGLHSSYHYYTEGTYFSQHQSCQETQVRQHGKAFQ
jgi:hypothetical protein